MWKSLLLAFFSLAFMDSFSQIIFENGYFIDESDQKINCLIKNIGWKNNPKEFQYKLTEGGEVSNATIESVREFGVEGASKYVRAKVKLDRSSDELINLTNDRNPIFKEELLFLKVVTEGKATLYSYEDGILTRFFYKTPEKEINQLVYKLYKVSGKLAQNNGYKQELSQSLSCQALDKTDFENLDYYRGKLEKLFIKYNKCRDPNFSNAAQKTKRDVFNLTIRPGLSAANINLRNGLYDYSNMEFNNKLGFRLGIEAEYVLPYNKNKWSILVEPTYQYLSTGQTNDTNNPSYGVVTANIAYKSIELPVGVRHYFFLTKESKIFVNALFVSDFSFNSTVTTKRGNGTDLDNLKIKSEFNPAVGVGYKLKNKWGIEIRYQKYRDILANYLLWKASYSSTALILGYTL
jgi:hypothetical protein